MKAGVIDISKKAWQRTFGRERPASVSPVPPREDAVDLPFVFCVGAQKAGTTWLYNYFLSHPDVHVSAVKEMHYFDVLWDKSSAGFRNMRRKSLERMSSGEKAKSRKASEPGDPNSIEMLRDLLEMYDGNASDHESYRRLMLKGAAGSSCVADVTPSYSMLDAGSYQRMAASFPSSKFIYMMRDPVERMWSHLKMHMNTMRRKGDPEMDVDKLLDLVLQGEQAHILKRSAYGKTLDALSTLPQNQVHYMFYESMFNDQAMTRLCRFLDVGFKSADYGTRVRDGNKQGMSPDQRDTLRWLCAPIYQKVHDIFGADVPPEWDVEARNTSRPGILDNTAIAKTVLMGAG